MAEIIKNVPDVIRHKKPSAPTVQEFTSNMKADSFGKTESWWEGFNKARAKRLNETQDQEKMLEEWKKEEIRLFELALGANAKERALELGIPYYELIKITPYRLDLIKTKVGVSIVMEAAKKNKKIKLHYLWFPEDNIRKYHLRDGNPPADVDRPKWMKRLPLQVDMRGVSKQTLNEARLVSRKRQADPNKAKEHPMVSIPSDMELNTMIEIMKNRK